MSTIEIELIPEFKGERVMLLAMDRDGLVAVRTALTEAQYGLASIAASGTVEMEFRSEPDQAAIDLDAMPAIWRLSPKKIDEIVEKLDAMEVFPGPCHHYVDIATPAKTLVLAKDEYLST